MTEKTMTVQEIAGAVGKDERSIRRWVHRAADKMSAIADKMSASSPMRPAQYTLEETLLIIETGMGKNAAAVWAQAATQTTRPAITPELVQEVTLLVAPMVLEIIRKQPLRIPIQQPIQQQLAAPPQIPPQSKRRWIRDVIVRWSNKHMVPVEDTWRNFYHQYYLRFGVNLHIRAKHEGIKPMDVLDNDEDLMLYAIRLVEHLYGEQWLGGV